MKIRKLIFSAKLEQIEKQNQNIFIFHCSANAAQWRFLKNFLFFSGRLAHSTERIACDSKGGPKVRSSASGSFSIDSTEYAGSLLPDKRASGISPFPMRQHTNPGPGATSELMHLRALEGISRAPSDADAPQVRDLASLAPMPQWPPADNPDGSLGRQDCSLYWLRGYTFFQSTSFKKKLLNPLEKEKYALTRLTADAPSSPPPKAGQTSSPFELRRPSSGGAYLLEDYLALSPICKQTSKGVYSRKRRPKNRKRSFTNKDRRQGRRPADKKFRPKGCLFFFDTRSHTVFETVRRMQTALELVNKIESLEFNNNLILLFGQMKSTVVNHVDLKEALILDTRTTYQQFFISMHSVSIALSLCLHQKIDEFFCIQETRKPSVPSADPGKKEPKV